MLSTSTKLQEEIGMIKFMSQLFSAYEEIAVMKMQRIRTGVFHNRKFLDELYSIFNESKILYFKRVSSLNGANQPTIDESSLTRFSTLNKNGKSIIVLISPDQKFSGNIGFEVFDDFYKHTKASAASEVLVIGIVGKQLVDGRGLTGYRYFELKSLKDKINYDSLRDYLLSYQKIDVHYGKFVNLLTQVKTVTDITGNTVNENAINLTSTDDYIFEPSIEAVMNFFEVQIMGVLLKQALAESELARLGSRINAMESASRNAKDTVKKLGIQKVMLDKSYANNKQIERMSGMSLWGEFI